MNKEYQLSSINLWREINNDFTSVHKIIEDIFILFHKYQLIPDYIQSYIRRKRAISLPASHRTTTEEEQLNKTTNIYQLKSLVNHLYCSIEWFKKYVDTNPKTNSWIKIENSNNNEVIEGVIKQDEHRNYFFENSIFQYTKVHNLIRIGTKIKITKTIENTSNTKNLYPKFKVNFEIVES